MKGAAPAGLHRNSSDQPYHCFFMPAQPKHSMTQVCLKHFSPGSTLTNVLQVAGMLILYDFFVAGVRVQIFICLQTIKAHYKLGTVNIISLTGMTSMTSINTNM